MKRFFANSFWGLFFFTAFPFALLAWPIPDTGQTKCYDDLGNEIDPCPQPGEPFYGQDGNFLINPPSYTKLGENGEELEDDATEWIMVRDNVTGLIWEMKQNNDDTVNYGNPHDANNIYSWYNPNPTVNGGDPGEPDIPSKRNSQAFISSLNSEKFGGFEDWRLPSLEELRSIVDYGQFDPAIDLDFFPGTADANYWSSTTVAINVADARNLNFQNGSDNSHNKSTLLPVRAVRGGFYSGDVNLIANSDGLITDSRFGLMWNPAIFSPRNWNDAVSACQTMNDGGFEDWRLPSLKELTSIMMLDQYNPAMDIGFFGEPVQSYFWTSTANISLESNAWRVNAYDGYDDDVAKAASWHVRAVRGGQAKREGGLFVEKPAQGSFWNMGAEIPVRWDTVNLHGNVAILISYEGGKPGTFETIAASTPNDGIYQWTVPDVSSFNCMLKIEPLNDPSKGTTQGLFTIGNFILSAPSALVLDEPANSTATPISKTFALTLTGDPSTDVELELASSNPGEFSISPTSITLTSANWDTGVQVTLTPEFDGLPDGDQSSSVLVSTVDPFSPFQAMDLPVCNVTVRDSSANPALFSVNPTLGTENQPLDVVLKGTKFSSATQVYLYPEGGASAEITPVTFIDKTTLSVTLPALPAGSYNLKAGNSELKNAVAFFQAATIGELSQKRAILVAGSGPFYDNGLWLSTDKCVRNAYRSLSAQGYGAEQIQLLTRNVGIDLTGDGQSDKDADATLAALQSAISGLTSSNADDLILFLVGPGADGQFQFGSNESPEYLTPAVLDGWLDDLQSRISGRVIVVLDACQAGSFLPHLRPPAGKERIVIASTASWESAWFLDDGEISFSHRLFDHLFDNAELFAAFDKAKAELSPFQTAQIDASGDGVPDLRRRREEETLVIGRGRFVEVSPPEIDSLSATPSLLDTGLFNSYLAATGVNAPAGLDRIWCRLVLPIEVLRNPANPVLHTPTVKLLDSGGQGTFENTYEEFLYDGDYRALAYAIDRAGVENLVPQQAVVTQTEGIPLEIDPGDVNVDDRVDLADAIRALQTAAGRHPHAIKYADADGDGRIGMEDAMFILQKVGNVRP